MIYIKKTLTYEFVKPAYNSLGLSIIVYRAKYTQIRLIQTINFKRHNWSNMLKMWAMPIDEMTQIFVIFTAFLCNLNTSLILLYVRLFSVASTSWPIMIMISRLWYNDYVVSRPTGYSLLKVTLHKNQLCFIYRCFLH